MAKQTKKTARKSATRSAKRERLRCSFGDRWLNPCDALAASTRTESAGTYGRRSYGIHFKMAIDGARSEGDRTGIEAVDVVGHAGTSRLLYCPFCSLRLRRGEAEPLSDQVLHLEDCLEELAHTD